jgi:hypothetical protein
MTTTKLAIALAAGAMATPAVAQSCPQDGPNSPLALHEAWIMQGWERRDGDPAFVFVDKMAKYYDLNDPTGVFWDNFAPGDTQLFTDASVYGPNWEGLQNASRSILHGMTKGHAVRQRRRSLHYCRFCRQNRTSERRGPGLRCALSAGLAVCGRRLEDQAGAELCLAGRARGHRGHSGKVAGPMSVAQAAHPYAGMWVTADGRIRHELLANGRYDEARGTRESAYQGRYEVTGNHIEYWDDTGFTADGEFIDGILYHAGMVMTRRP